MIRNILLSLLLLAVPSIAMAQGVVFQHTDVAAAQKAAAADQLIFVDLYAEWCGPCKMMDKQVFPLASVGSYANENFVTCRINADSKEGKAFMEKHQIQGLPTLLVLNASGEIVAKQTGMLDEYGMIRFLKASRKDLPDMEDLYKAHRKDKNNPELMLPILLEAPFYMQTLRSENQAKKWIVRIEDTFKAYVDAKGVDKMTSPIDFRVLSMYHQRYTKDDPIVEKMVRYFTDFTKQNSPEQVAQYITALHLSYTIGLAQECNEEYKREASRIGGDMKHIYGVIHADPEGYGTGIAALTNGVCSLNRKEYAAYVEQINTYLEYLPKVQYNDYAQAIEGLYNAISDNLDATSAKAILAWGARAVELKPDTEALATLNLVLGDCHKALNDKEKAKECYNTAFTQIMKSQKSAMIEQLQPMIKARLEALAQ